MQDEEDGTFPELNCFSLTSEYLRILVSWQACLTRCSWQAWPYRCALGFRPRSEHLLPPETTPEREKYWQQLHVLDLRNGETPSPACTLLYANTHVL